MSTKPLYASTLMLAVLSSCAWAQELVPTQYSPARRLDPVPLAELIPAPTTAAGPAGPAVNPPMATHGLSPWVTYQQPDCCGPIGQHGDICGELYIHSGPAFASSGGLSNLVDDGWLIEGGLRSLYFNASDRAAWTADFGIGYIHNSGNGVLVPDTIFGVPYTVRDLHRTMVNLNFGRERYLRGSYHSDGWRLRAGWDAGIRWGTTRLDVNDATNNGSFDRFNSWDWGPVVAGHTDLEIPCGCCSWQIGCRVEWEEIHNPRLPIGFPRDIRDVNLLVNLGVRY